MSSFAMAYRPCRRFMVRNACLARGDSYPCSAISAMSSAVSSYRFCGLVANSPVRSRSAEMLGTQYVRKSASSSERRWSNGNSNPAESR